MNKRDRNVRCFSQFKNSYGKPLVIIGEKIIVLTKLSVHLPPPPPTPPKSQMVHPLVKIYCKE